MESKTNVSYKQYDIVLNVPNLNASDHLSNEKGAHDILNALSIKLPSLANNYYFILHDKDTNDNGELKTEHIHVVLELENKIGKLNLLSLLSKELELPTECISLEPCRNKQASIKYLIHFNHPNKYQYKLDNIYTNDDNLELNFINQQIIKKAIFESKDIRELINRIGIDNANKYKSLFNQVQNDINVNLQEKYDNLSIKYRKLENALALAVKELAKERQSDYSTEYDRLLRLTKK